MARPKRNSAALERAERRLESLQSLDHTLDLGSGLVRNTKWQAAPAANGVVSEQFQQQ